MASQANAVSWIIHLGIIIILNVLATLDYLGFGFS
jgi:hypothetical protein